MWQIVLSRRQFGVTLQRGSDYVLLCHPLYVLLLLSEVIFIRKSMLCERFSFQF